MIWRLSGGRDIDFGTHVVVLGVLNVTPDSFFDGGRHDDVSAAAETALRLHEEGADIIDIGGESSRPPMYGAAATVTVEQECDRVLPVIRRIRQQCDVPISIDTVKTRVAARALDAGADILNDISALEVGGAEMARVVAQFQAPALLMHKRGTPATMQDDTHYDDLTAEVAGYLRDRVAFAGEHGVEKVAVDPGVGFGKSVQGNHELIRHAGQFSVQGCPVVIGASRKSFIWKPVGGSPDTALAGSLAAAVLAVSHGARAVRVHDVAETVRAVRLADAVEQEPELAHG